MAKEDRDLLRQPATLAKVIIEGDKGDKQYFKHDPEGLGKRTTVR